MEYWHGILIEKSWKVLQEIKKKFNFVLIGGWATYLWSRTHKSKDIDIIVDFPTLSKLKKSFNLKKNDNLKKYEIRINEIDIDIYVPFYSKLLLLERIESEKIDGFKVPKLEYLLILKQSAEEKRGFSEKGEKDRIDIMSLLFNCNIDFKEYLSILKKVKKEAYLKRLIQLVKNFKDYKYLDLNPRELKIKKKEILEKLKRV